MIMESKIIKVFKMQFTAPVRFGADTPGVGVEKVNMTCHADTLFSALCCEAVLLYGSDGANELFEWADNGKLCLSDLVPFDECNLFLPKPIIIPGARSEKTSIDSTQKKLLKKLKYIPLDSWDDYIAMINGVDELDIEGFGAFAGAYEMLQPKVSVSRIGEDGKPFVAGAYVFKPTCGLYFIARCADDIVCEKIEQLMTSLQYSGIGGERSSGWGKFEYTVEDLPTGFPALQTTTSDNYKMALSCISPDERDLLELPHGYYTLARREGFVLSQSYSVNQLKRKALHMLNAGSCFKNKLNGCVQDVSQDGGHPVYRYGKGMFVEIQVSRGDDAN